MKTRSPFWIEERDVLAIQGRLLSLHGGGEGLRDPGFLQSALARPRQHRAYAGSPDIFAMVALYAAGIIRNHPFVDGNKRTGFVVGVLFLELNGFDFRAREEDAIQAVFSLASGTLDEAGYAEWLRANSGRQRRR